MTRRPKSAPSETSGRILWALFAVAALAYAPFLGGEFLLDDFPLIADNPYLRLSHLGGFFEKSLWANTALPPVTDALYRPLALLYYWLVATLGGGAAWAFHGTALALLALNGVLVAKLAQRWFAGLPVGVAVAAGLVYALHPAHVQAVLWAVGGAEELATAFALGSLLAFGRRRTLSAVLFVLALLTKETALALPVFVAVWPLLRGRDEPYPRRDVALFAALAAGYLAVRTAVVGFGAVQGAPDTWARLAAIAALLARHTLAPWPQPFWLQVPGDAMAGMLDYALGGAALIGLAALWRIAPKTRAAVAFAVLSAAPALALAFIPGIGVFAMRYLVLPLAGVALAAAIGLAALYARTKAGFAAVLSLLGLIEIGMVAGEAPYWHDETRLAEKILQFDPASPKGYDVLANAAARRGDAAGVIAARGRALAAASAGVTRCDALEKLALAHKDAEHFAESLEAYRAMMGECLDAVQLARAWVGVGNNLWVLGKLDDALNAYRTAASHNPLSFLANYNAGNVLETMGRREEALAWYRKVIALPRSPEWDADADAHAREAVGGRR